jgi:maltoporin
LLRQRLHGGEDGRGYVDRPVLRLFVTHAHWNAAARSAAANGDPLSATGIFGNALGGDTLGVAFENC